MLSDCLPKVLLLIVAGILLSCTYAHSDHVDLYEGSACKLHTGALGVCKKSRQCDWHFQNLQAHSMQFSDINISTFTNEDVVCCADEQPNPSKRPTDNEIFVWPEPTTGTQKPTTSSIPSRFSGQKMKAACDKYSELATTYIPSYIINGREAGLTEFPHMAALGYTNSENGAYDFDCGGSLIAEQWILTAAHCIKERRMPKMVRLGKLSLRSDQDGLVAVDRPITRIMKHPEYSAQTKKNDIALIQFDGAIEFDDYVRPACLRTSVHEISESVELLITGWGSIEAERTNRSAVLMKANVTSVPMSSCNEILLQFNDRANQPSLRGGLGAGQMCALDTRHQSDACVGDSGGPLFLYNLTGVTTVVGITSFGISCGTSLPSVYTRVAYYMDWIESNVWP